MNKYLKALLSFCSTLGLGLLATQNVQGTTLTNLSVSVEPFLEINLDNTSILENENDVILNTEGNLILVTNPFITVEKNTSEPILGIELSSILSEKNFIANITGELEILGEIDSSNGNKIELNANSITLDSSLLSITTSEVENIITDHPIQLSLDNGITVVRSPITINPNPETEANTGTSGGGTSGGSITITIDNLVIGSPITSTTVPEPYSIFSLLTVTLTSSFLGIKHKLKA